MKLEIAQKGPLRARFSVGAIRKGKGYRQSGEDLKPRTDKVSLGLCNALCDSDSDMEWEMKCRRGDQLGAVGAEARDVESSGSGRGCGKEGDGRFLGCGFNSVGRMNGVLEGERPVKTWTGFVKQAAGMVGLLPSTKMSGSSEGHSDFGVPCSLLLHTQFSRY